jgi:hypothetical protein
MTNNEETNKVEGSRRFMAKGKKTGGRRPGVPNKATRELKELAQPYAPKAIETLLWIMEHGQTEAARVAAARELLDRGYGRPVGSGTQVNVSATGQQGINVVCDERARQELIEQRERLLAAKTLLEG